MNSIYSDNVFQVYESNGNIHIITGHSTGETSSDGKDIYEKNFKFTLPASVAKEMALGVLSLTGGEQNNSEINHHAENFTTSQAPQSAGNPLIFKI